MPRSKSDFFNSWKSDNLPKIEKAFNEKGFEVVELDDIQHYQGFNELGRRVKRGEKSVYIQSDKTYPQPIFKNGQLIKDEQGKNVIREIKKGYSLFHVDQTVEVK